MTSIDEILKVKPVLSDEQAHVFLLQLSLFNSKDLLPYLSEDEHSRACKLKVEQKKDQFVITRGLLRQLLSNYLEKEPKEIMFSYEQHCKPIINDKVNNKSVEFNISHSGDYALIAMSLENKVGVDIEEINPGIDYQSLSKRFFSEKENKELTSLDKDEQLDAFYRTWVRKESFIKAIGKGVAFGLDRFSVSLEENKKTEMEVVTPEPTNDKWFCYDLINLDNYKTALTTCRKGIDIIISN
jgi:4'-phosphopantetheinyl transferase